MKLLTNLYGIFCGKDGQLSIRRIMAAGAFWRFIALDCQTPAQDYIWALVFLIGAMLGMTTYQNIATKMNQNTTAE